MNTLILRFIVLHHTLYIAGAEFIKNTKQFGCTFDDAGYNLDSTKWKRNWPIDPVYGDKREGALNFQNEKDFKKFHEKVVEIRNNIFKSGKYVYNSLEPFVKFYEEFSSTKKKMFGSFFRNYVPKFPYLDKKVPGNLWNGLIWIYKDLVQYDKRVEDHFTMATCDKWLKSKDVESLVSNHPKKPPCSFHHEDMAGVIRFSIGGKRFGYLVIDVTGAIHPMPVIMEDEKDPLHHNKVFANDDARNLHYILRRKPNSTASYIQMNYIKGYTERTDMIFIGSSLCSFASIEKGALLNPIREILQFHERGHLLAVIWVDLNQPAAKAKDSKKAGPQKYYIRMHWYNSTLSQYERLYLELERFAKKGYTAEFLDKIINQMQISREAVYHQLQVISDIMLHDAEFIKEIRYWYKTVVLPSQSKVSNVANQLKINMN